jgi:aminopeptidase N
MESSRKPTMKNGAKPKSHERRYHALIRILCVVTCMLIGFPSGATPQDIPAVIMDISFDVGRGLMKGKSTITLPQGRRYIGIKGLRMLTMKLDGIPITPVVTEGSFRIEAREGSILEMTYECPAAEGSTCVIGKDGIVLLDDWYPSMEGLAFYKLSASVPGNSQAVSEAEEVVIEKVEGGSRFTFEFPHPLEGVHFIASNYTVRQESYHGVEIFTYFFPVDAHLAESYMEHTKKFLDLYLRLIGDFPYKRFSVVENLMPTGYSMPTFTLLGQEVVRLPFIVRTSLGHEILHQWLGNLVYVDYRSGNWSEGLTTYLSDHLYEEMAGRGWEYRKQILLDYQNYVTPGKDFPLTEFRSRTDFASKAIGYGKAAMVFHMLRKLSGDRLFFEAIREFIGRERFKQASWNDIRRAFEKVSGKDLGWFFSQWISEKGSPSIVVTPKEISPRGLRSVLSIGITQGEKKYILDIPSVVKTDQGETSATLKIGRATEELEVVVDGNPERLIIDGGYDTFRRLSEKEIPPRIAQILAEENGILVLPQRVREDPVYSDAVSFFEGRKFVVRDPNSIKERELRGATAVVLGCDNWIARRLFGGINCDSPGLVFTVKKNPLNLLKAIAFLHADSGEDMKATLEKIMHYGKYSTVSFRKGNNVDKKIDESERGRAITVLEPIYGIEESKELSLNEIIDRVSGQKIVYVGEQHDQYSSHLTELEVIRGLFRKGGRIAIGMEMFARHYQKAIDDYIEGTTGEREFLRSSDYFKQWGFDYNLYQDILMFAREEKIPVVALNIRKEIVGKVAKGGIDFLTPEEKRELPEDMDLTDEQYKDRLRSVFIEHESFGERSFENFYQCQIIWDEIMAKTVDEFMRSHPGYRMVVLAGSGHLAYGSGIPKRAYRRNGLDYAIILNEGSVDRGIADYNVFPKPVMAVTAPKLMVMLREEKDGFTITGFLPHSISEKAGLRKGDKIIALDGEKVKDMQDIRIALFFKKKGETLRVTVLRKQFLLGERVLNVEVTL